MAPKGRITTPVRYRSFWEDTTPPYPLFLSLLLLGLTLITLDYSVDGLSKIITMKSLMFGKSFESMYEGSMVGAGAVKFAVWGYVITKMRPDAELGAVVSLNSRLIAPILGESVELVQDAIEWLCSPDPNSRTKIEEGRRLVQLGQFDYQVVNGAYYRALRDEESRRKQLREAQQRFRDKEKAKSVGKFHKKTSLPSKQKVENSGPWTPPTEPGPTVDPCYYDNKHHPEPQPVKQTSDRPRTTHDPQFNGSDESPEPIEKSVEQFMDENL